MNYMKVKASCPICKQAKQFYFRTNNPFEFEKLWLSGSWKRFKCHKQETVLEITEGEAVEDEIDNLTYIEKKNNLSTMNF